MEIWVKDFSPGNSPGKSILLNFLEKRKLQHVSWSSSVTAFIGLILSNIDGSDEECIHFLETHAKQKAHRVMVINFHNSALSSAHQFNLYEAGAEYVFQFSQISDRLECIADKLERWRNIASMLTSIQSKSNIVGNSPVFKRVLQEIIEVSLYSKVPVLISGERGTGKELIAKLVHEYDGRTQKGNLVVVDCTTLKKELSGSELFGHEKGSYTGADYAREGAFALANNGTLFLDEIGELPLHLQAELLRIIQEGTYKKTGSNIWKHTSFRLIAATNRNLDDELISENFRKDLYDRISVYKCTVPSLYERREDIPQLIHFFLKQHYPAVPCVDKTVIDFLYERSYPGNIRELKNLVSRICLRYIGHGPVTLGDLMWYDKPVPPAIKQRWFERSEFISSIKQAIEDGYEMKKIEDVVKDIAIQTALSLHGKNKLVSEALGVSDRWVQQRRAKEKLSEM
ncbi:MAG: sigma-54-dependent Fis family transcriptional regulator [Chitinophagaceae bacterium]|nr:sigma-54-dependent Fis family transcriptional regulator [Chitinophagaceae bacterium]